MPAPHWTTIAALLALVACAAPRRHEPPVGYGAVVVPPPDADGQGGARRPTILSAHLAIDEGGDEDVLVVVFSTEVDPLGLEPHHFAVLLRDGRYSHPVRAVLAPANESDENRTVALIGDFGDAEDNPPTLVTVAGLVHAEDGAVLQGLGLEVRAFAEPGTIVHAERLAGSERACADAPHVIRTYWTDGLQGVTRDALPRIRVSTSGAEEVQPSAFDDHPVGGDERGADNVLDLCVDGEATPVRLQIPADVFTDPAGHPNAAVSIDVVERTP